MRRKLLAVLVVLAGGLVIMSPARAAIDRPVAVWQMNEPPGSRTMVDSSGNGINGAIGAHVLVGTALSGGGIGTAFPTSSPTRRPPTPSTWCGWRTTRG